MHIPDGYLSPETCAALYATATPFWYVALSRIKKLLNTRFVPLIAVFSAFSFVIMMFNLPLPGGTTGHAVGMGVATVILGPWASILAISTALVIQALFFGDGGVTTIGANCFNMAIVGSLAAYGFYRLLSRGARIGSRRRVIAAAVAGYGAINLSALCAGIEFGIQPMLFHDATGTPLYCPYPLSISIPAMLIGHVTFAGLAELVITGGVVAYLQRADPALLKQTAPDAPDRDSAIAGSGEGAAVPSLRRLWLALSVLLVLTPLGVLAVGSAWGEWSARDFRDPGVRRQISAASANRLPPNPPPRGFERLSTIWTAPLPRYAPVFIRSASFGYLVSAMAGVGLIILVLLLLDLLLKRQKQYSSGPGPPAHAGRFRRGFIEKTVKGLGEALEHSVFAEELARSRGLLQELDPRVKVAGIACLVIAAAAVYRIPVLLALFGIAALAAAASHVPPKTLLTKIWMPVFIFSGVVALPAVFLTSGSIVGQVPVLHWQITKQGLTTSSLLVLRAETAATFSALLVLTTEWAGVLRALRFFRIPVTAVVILGMTYRYVILLLKTACEMFESRQSRLIGTLEGPERRRLAAATVGVLLSKSFQLSTEVHAAMRSRGFQGEVYLLDEFAINSRDWIQLGLLVAVATTALILGR